MFDDIEVTISKEDENENGKLKDTYKNPALTVDALVTRKSPKDEKTV